MPFVGRGELLQAIAGELGETTRQAVLVLRGPSGVGKSEFAREFARVSAARYPGGRVVLDAGGEGPEVELARLGTALLDLGAPPPGMEIADQALRALRGARRRAERLLYDNVRRPEDIEAWLPPDGMPCHVLITSTLESWGPGWPVLDVRPLGDDDVIGLVRAIAGGEAADRFGDRMVKQAGGLPVQIVPMSAMLEKQARRGRLDEADLTLAREAGESFRGVYERLDAPARNPAPHRRAVQPAADPARRARARADRGARLDRPRAPRRPRRVPRPLSAAGGAGAQDAPAPRELPARPAARETKPPGGSIACSRCRRGGWWRRRARCRTIRRTPPSLRGCWPFRSRPVHGRLVPRRMAKLSGAP